MFLPKVFSARVHFMHVVPNTDSPGKMLHKTNFLCTQTLKN